MRSSVPALAAPPARRRGTAPSTGRPSVQVLIKLARGRWQGESFPLIFKNREALSLHQVMRERGRLGGFSTCKSLRFITLKRNFYLQPY